LLGWITKIAKIDYRLRVLPVFWLARVEQATKIMAIFIIATEDTLAKQHLAELLKELRSGETQRQFAKRLGTSYTSIQDWEKQIRLPSEKNLQRIAQLKGWTYEELILFLFGNDAQSAIATTEPLKIIMACVPKLSSEQRQQLSDYFTSKIDKIPDLQDKRTYNLSNHQKHNLHLLLRASLRQQDPLEAMEQEGIEPELFADVFLRDDKNRKVGYEELKQFSHLCRLVIQWQGDRLPEVDLHQTYRGKIDMFFNDLLGMNSPVWTER
jgi:transcriptional regulator with XRE-family HTH domain